MDKKCYDALSSAIYLNAMALNGKSVSSDDQRIRASGLYDDWRAGKHAVGEVCNTHAENGLGGEWAQTWECFQAYDNAVYPDIVPGNAAWYTFHRPLHGKSRGTARPFVAVRGSHDLYRVGEYMIYTDGLAYRCKRDTNFSPTDDPTAWESGD